MNYELNIKLVEEGETLFLNQAPGFMTQQYILSSADYKAYLKEVYLKNENYITIAGYCDYLKRVFSYFY